VDKLITKFNSVIFPASCPSEAQFWRTFYKFLRYPGLQPSCPEWSPVQQCILSRYGVSLSLPSLPSPSVSGDYFFSVWWEFSANV
jgi:hypothetical protein